MLKFMRHQHKLTPERIQKQKELYAFTKSCHHGFPSKTSALAWDPELRLLALTTKTGELRVYGSEGVEFYGEHDADVTVVKVVFIPGQGHLVTLCDDNSLHLWQLQQDDKLSGLHKIKSTLLEGKLKRISVIVVDSTCENLMIGTEGGNIYLLNLSSFVMSDNIIYQDVVMQNVPEDYKVNPGSVETIAQHPTDPNKILIAYVRGLIVIWDKKALAADQTYICSQQLESVCWHADATKFISSHNDGSYIIWSAEDSEKPNDGPNTVYGPFPCKPITKINWAEGKDGDFIIFSGGMPRGLHGDRSTITAIQGEKHVTFNLTSKVIDYVVIKSKTSGGAECIVALAEEEIVFIDLLTEDWPAFHNPYLSSLHCSAITCSYYVSDVAADVYKKIKEVGESQLTGFSKREWPVDGGENISTESKSHDILLTGHEDGTVRFWDASGVALSLIYKLSTCPLFISDDMGEFGGGEDEDWPPFRKVGLFDPYSDDPRFGVKKLEMCPYSGTLIVAGTAGQIIAMELNNEEKEIEIKSIDVNLVAENDSFVWKSHAKLEMKQEPVKHSPGMQPTSVMQFYPPASCTSLNLHSEWGLVACGTAHGFALFDIIQNKCLLAKSTLSATDLINAADEGPMSRRKSLKKSLRESFRRLRRGRSQRKSNRNKTKIPANTTNTTSPPPVKPTANEEENVRPVERAVEARTHTAGYIGSMVRCLHLTKCFISANQVMSATLWAGTNSGTILVYTIAIPSSDKRATVPLQVLLGKEINLKHGAPVINIMILDASNRPFPRPLAVKKEAAPPPDTQGSHKVLICSEEQFKVFSLPQLKHFCKYKLTAIDGSRVRKIGSCDFVSSVDEKYKEPAFLVATNQGDFNVFCLPECRRQVQAQCLRKEDISGINSIVFTDKGEAIYQVSASELTRISLSARYQTKPKGKVQIVASKILAETKKEEETTPVVETETQENTQCNEEPKSEKTETETTENAEETTATSETSKNVKIATTEVAVEKKVEEINGDTSMLSGDITIDSIKDHMDESKQISVATASAEGASSTTTVISTANNKSKQESTTNVSVIKSTTVTSITSQETQVVETLTSSEVNRNAVNGSE